MVATARRPSLGLAFVQSYLPSLNGGGPSAWTGIAFRVVKPSSGRTHCADQRPPGSFVNFDALPPTRCWAVCANIVTGAYATLKDKTHRIAHCFKRNPSPGCEVPWAAPGFGKVIQTISAHAAKRHLLDCTLGDYVCLGIWAYADR